MKLEEAVGIYSTLTYSVVQVVTPSKDLLEIIKTLEEIILKKLKKENEE